MKGVYLELSDVCKLLGRPPTRRNVERLAIDVRRRLAAAKGKLDRYDPRRGGRNYRFTEVSLKYIFPEFHDRRDDIEKKLAAQFREIQKAIDELAGRLRREAELSRARDEILADAVRAVRKGRSAA